MKIATLMKYLKGMPAISNEGAYQTNWKYKSKPLFISRGCMSFIKGNLLEDVLIQPPNEVFGDQPYPFTEYQWKRFIRSISGFSPTLAKLESDYDTKTTTILKEWPPMLRYFVMLNIRAAWEHPKYVYMFNYLTSNNFTPLQCMWILSISRYIWAGGTGSMWEFSPRIDGIGGKGALKAYEDSFNARIGTSNLDNNMWVTASKYSYSNRYRLDDDHAEKLLTTSPFFHLDSSHIKIFKQHEKIRTWLALYTDKKEK